MIPELHEMRLAVFPKREIPLIAELRYNPQRARGLAMTLRGYDHSTSIGLRARLLAERYCGERRDTVCLQVG